ncbi:MAG TPA: HAD family phosphatase [Bryocella sp.]|nr:HAD family phosphatase [Bryocella sp.]
MPEVNTPTERLPIPDRVFGAYLFDLDGTIADSMPVHLITWQQAVREAGGDFPEELFWAWGGMPLPRTVEMLNERFGYHMSAPEVVHRKEQLYLDMIDRVRPIASVAAHITEQHGKIPMAVVSGSPCLTITRTLQALHLDKCFDAVVGAEDYTHGKPDPEPFLTAARMLKVAPADCLVFEDADLGIKAAEAAGMTWVQVPVHPLAVSV